MGDEPDAVDLSDRRRQQGIRLWDHHIVSDLSLPVTARLAAAGRAVETRRADRLFADPLAEVLAGEEGFRLMERWRLPGAPRENPTIGPRTRFYDDVVVDSIAAGVGQVVLIAAGMDTRAFRLPLPADAVVYELDLPRVLAHKQAIIEQQHATPCCGRCVVAVDLTHDGWPQTLTAAGFDQTAPTVFIVEGLSWYLAEEENARLLDLLSGLAAPGSRLGIDIISRDQLESPAAASFFAFTASLGIFWRFGTNDPTAFLAAHGWHAEVTALDAFARRIGRPTSPEAPAAVARDGIATRSRFDSRTPDRSASVLLH